MQIIITILLINLRNELKWSRLKIWITRYNFPHIWMSVKSQYKSVWILIYFIQVKFYIVQNEEQVKQSDNFKIYLNVQWFIIIIIIIIIIYF